MIRVLLFLFFGLSLSANTLLVDTDTKFATTTHSQITIEDPDHTLTKEDILHNNFPSFSTKIKFPHSHSIYWTKGRIKNSSNQPLGLIGRNLRAGTDFIDVYIYDDEKLIATHLLGDLRAQASKELLSTKSVFYVVLEPNTTYTIITKYQCYGAFDLYWEFLNPQDYSYINGLENIAHGVFGGIILALIIYNLMLYFTFKETMFLYYITHGFFVWWLSFSLAGVFYFLDIGLELEFLTASTWIAPALMVIFMLLFIKEFFQIERKTKLFFYLILFFIVTLLGYLCTFIYGYFTDLYILSRVSPVFINILFIAYLFVLVIALWGVKNKIEGAKFILIGESIYLLALVYTTFIIKGNLENSSYSSFMIPLGIVSEMIFFALALGSRIKKIKLELENRKLISLQEEHYTQYGKIVGNISHQWKQPLSFLASEIMYLNTLKLLGRENEITDQFLLTAPKLNYTIELMGQTINLFNEFYKNDGVITPIKIKSEIEQILSMYQYKILSHTISCDLKCDEDLTLLGHKSSFLQIVMTLLDNSIDQFERNDTQKPIITLEVITYEKYIELLYQDNGGGIEGKIDEIFKPHYSTKKGNSGMGFHILEIILTQKFNGTIKVHNQNNGVFFDLNFPKKSIS